MSFSSISVAQSALTASRVRKDLYKRMWKASGYSNDKYYQRFLEAVDQEKVAKNFLKKHGVDECQE